MRLCSTSGIVIASAISNLRGLGAGEVLVGENVEMLVIEIVV